MNIMTTTDFYKTGHASMMEGGTNKIYSNFTPRSARLFQAPEGFDDKVVWWGLQAVCQEVLINEFKNGFFNIPKERAVARYKQRMDTSLGPNKVSGDQIAALHDLQYLPVVIKSLPEGSLVPIKVPTMAITNTHPDFAWLTNYLETLLSCELWKPTTTATIAFEYKKLLTKYAVETGADLGTIPIQAHDFSFRGMSGRADAAASGTGHLLSFIGTDTIPAIERLEDYYGADCLSEMIGCSVPATEHAVMCLGQKDSELNTFKRLVTESNPTGIISIVSDTWDFWKVITEFTQELKEDILNRQPDEWGLCKTVFRPDSGDPADILCGNPDAEVGTPEYKGAVECLWEVFGGTETEKGYKVLNDKVGLIYGDSITLERANDILSRLKAKGFASTNVVFGIGSYTYQYITRDTFGWAMKATYAEVNGQPRELFKDPITDSGVKKSAKGLLRVEEEDGEYVLYDRQTPEQEAQGCLQEVFRDGRMVKRTTLSQARELLSSYM